MGSLLDLLGADDETLLARHGRWYLAGRDPRWLRRNALIAVGNVADPADPDVASALVRYLGDRDPMLRAHAVWACRRLGREDLLDALVRVDEPEVAEELAAPSPAPTRAPPQPARGRA
jgi:epoxyqueuosine reductase